MDAVHKTYRLDGSRRLHGRRAFGAVFDARCRKHAGPIVVCGKPSGLGYCRLGLSVSRRVGIAVRRNRIKRLLREAFRLCQHDFPTGVVGLEGYDVVLVVRPHDPAKLTDYQGWLMQGLRAVDKHWQRRASGRGGKALLPLRSQP